MRRLPSLFKVRLPKSALLPGLAAIALGTTAGQTQAADIVEDFESGPNIVVETNSHEETLGETVEDSATPENHAMKLSWKAHSGTHVAAHLSPPGAPLIEEPGVYKVTAKANLEQCPPEVVKVALGVVDKDHETFQFSAPVELHGEPGWTELEWVINTKDPLPGAAKSWGAKVNEQMDFPVRFLGFAAPLKGGRTDGGTILFDDVSVSKLSDE